MQLPQEIRDEIYATVFRSTRLTFGERYLGRDGGMRVLSSARGTMLALLHTCRRVKEEIGVSWLHYMLFHFESPMVLMGKLAGIPITVREQIRHVRVWWHITLGWVDVQYACYNAPEYLKLPPGLRLDTLTILDDNPGRRCYDALELMVRYDDGWKELHYLSRTSAPLGYKYDKSSNGPPDPTRWNLMNQPQPSGWQNDLEHRDGQASHPSAMVYRATDNATSGAVLDPGARKVFIQAFTAPQDTRTFVEGEDEDAALMAPGEIEKELLVVVKRGAGVDYAMKEGSPHLPLDIRRDRPGEPFEWINPPNDRYPQEEREDYEVFDDDGIEDAYNHVDEYKWPRKTGW